MMLKMKDELGSFGKLALAHAGGCAGQGWWSGRCSEMGSFGTRVVCLGRLGLGCRAASGLASVGVGAAIP